MIIMLKTKKKMNNNSHNNKKKKNKRKRRIKKTKSRKLIEIYKDPRIIKFIHIPVQSGSNKVLKEMNRRYKIEDFKKIVTEFRKAIPNICISTDIIVGYPTETEEDFIETKKLLEDFKLEVVNLSKFAPRPKTLASQLKPISIETMKERSKILFNIIQN